MPKQTMSTSTEFDQHEQLTLCTRLKLFEKDVYSIISQLLPANIPILNKEAQDVLYQEFTNQIKANIIP